MSKLNRDNLRKTISYLQKNGFRNTIYAARERLEKKETDAYTYTAPSGEELERQRRTVWEYPVSFDIIVPAYRTAAEYFEEMAASVLGQTYPHFRLILVDASGREDDTVERQLRRLTDSRIQYYKLGKNLGIAENTNIGLQLADGDYAALLDHDDVLAPDALYEFASAIERERERGVELKLLYSDEDKCNEDMTRFYEPHYKRDFDPDLLLTNNYICHFTAMDTKLAKKLRLRGEYDGAQDFDFFLRAVEVLKDTPEAVCHVPKVLYHWRCHDSSTAANPESKRYAYEAGLRAVRDYCDRQGWRARAVHLKHLGFYRVEYQGDIFAQRTDLAAVGGSLVDRGKIVGGLMEETKESGCKITYENLSINYSGYMNRAVLVQQAEVLDIRCIKIRSECQNIFETVTNAPYIETITKEGQVIFDWHTLPVETDYLRLSQELSKTLRDYGYHLLWDPWLRAE